MRAAQRQRQPVLVGGREDQMDVVGHLAIGRDFDAEAPARLSEPVAIERIVVGFEKYPLAAIAALRDMMGNVRDDDASDASRGLDSTAQ